MVTVRTVGTLFKILYNTARQLVELRLIAEVVAGDEVIFRHRA